MLTRPLFSPSFPRQSCVLLGDVLPFRAALPSQNARDQATRAAAFACELGFNYFLVGIRDSEKKYTDLLEQRIFKPNRILFLW